MNLDSSEQSPSFAIPTAMNWTILPVSLTALCWIDETFKASFLSNPDILISERDRPRSIPAGATFHIHENSSTVRHLALPFFNSALAGMSRSDVSSLLQIETGNDQSLNWFLPADVIEEAFYSSAFHSSLLSNPAAALDTMGYLTTGMTIYVHANTSMEFNIALPPAPSGVDSSTSYETALAAAHTLLDAA